ncbi:MAG TPA: hydroxymethylbilane synthase [Candidatus Limnocylindrales bacterium]|jgi:hydroxymethylbilane synthase
MNQAPTIRIGTRGSALAMAQATQVRVALEAAGVPAELAIVTTDGDRRAPDTAWGEGAFVTAIEAQLLDGDVQVAVHSAKDVPTDEDPRLVIAAYLPRAPQGDVLVFPSGRPGTSLDDLPSGARVGTDSPRRTAFLRAVRPDLQLHPLHGNVDTRLRRLDEGQSDALVLAEAGLTRLGREDRISVRLAHELVPPAPGQGAIAVQARADDGPTRAALALLDDESTRLAVELERSVLAASGGGCRAPVGVAAAVARDGAFDVLAGFARPDGTLTILQRASGDRVDPDLPARIVANLADEAARLAAGRAWPRVVITRAADQAPPLALALVDRGLTPVLVPAIAIEPDPAAAHAALAAMRESDWVIVTSANAVHALTAAAESSGMTLNGNGHGDGNGNGNGHAPRWAAVGIATARALRSAGVEVAYRPARATGRDLAATVPMAAGDRVLVPRGDLADQATVEALEARGAHVTAVTAYRTSEAPEASLGALRSALSVRPGAVIVTSGSTVRGWLALAERLGALEAVRAIPVVAIGTETAAEAERLGLTIAATATRQAVAAIADATAGYLRPNPEAP